MLKPVSVAAQAHRDFLKNAAEISIITDREAVCKYDGLHLKVMIDFEKLSVKSSSNWQGRHPSIRFAKIDELRESWADVAPSGNRTACLYHMLSLLVDILDERNGCPARRKCEAGEARAAEELRLAVGANWDKDEALQKLGEAVDQRKTEELRKAKEAYLEAFAEEEFQRKCVKQQKEKEADERRKAEDRLAVEKAEQEHDGWYALISWGMSYKGPHGPWSTLAEAKQAVSDYFDRVNGSGADSGTMVNLAKPRIMGPYRTREAARNADYCDRRIGHAYG